MGPALILQNQDNLLYLWNQEIYALSENPKEEYPAISSCLKPNLTWVMQQDNDQKTPAPTTFLSVEATWKC